MSGKPQKMEVDAEEELHQFNKLLTVNKLNHQDFSHLLTLITATYQYLYHRIAALRH